MTSESSPAGEHVAPAPAGRARSLLGESPFWHPDEQVLYYVDIQGKALRRFDPATGGETNWVFESEPGCCAPTLGPEIVVARRDGIHLHDPRDGSSRQIAPSPCPNPAVERFNDGKCDAHGRLWCGTVFEPKTPPGGALYCLERGCLTRRAGGVLTSNGLDWSPDGRLMYWTDTPTHEIRVMNFDVPSGAFGEPRVFARFASRDRSRPIEHYGGRPDGAAVDAEGNYWVAMYEGARVLQLSPSGEVLREVRVPVQCPTMPCFGGSDLQTLFVTTASTRPAEELGAQPWAGRVLAWRVDTPGLPARRYLP